MYLVSCAWVILKGEERIQVQYQWISGRKIPVIPRTWRRGRRDEEGRRGEEGRREEEGRSGGERRREGEGSKGRRGVREERSE